MHWGHCHFFSWLIAFAPLSHPPPVRLQRPLFQTGQPPVYQQLGVTRQQSELQSVNVLFKLSSNCQCAAALNGSKVDVVFEGFRVFSPDCDIGILYQPQCAGISPNTNVQRTGRSERRQSVTCWRANFLSVFH